MKKIIGITLLFTVILTGCKQKSSSTISTSNVEKIWIYQGVIPCADCEGIRLTLKLNIIENTYEEEMVYLGRDTQAFVSKGKYNTERGFGTDKDATVFILDWDKPESEQDYFMHYSSDPATLIKLSTSKQIIETDLNYSLKRQ